MALTKEHAIYSYIIGRYAVDGTEEHYITEYQLFLEEDDVVYELARLMENHPEPRSLFIGTTPMKWNSKPADMEIKPRKDLLKRARTLANIS